MILLRRKKSFELYAGTSRGFRFQNVIKIRHRPKPSPSGSIKLKPANLRKEEGRPDVPPESNKRDLLARQGSKLNIKALTFFRMTIAAVFSIDLNGSGVEGQK